MKRHRSLNAPMTVPGAAAQFSQSQSRRHILRMGSGVLAAMLGGGTEGAADQKQEDRFSGFDREMRAFMGARDIPGGALAVVKDGRLVYARGYGLADREQRLPVRPDSLFRIASISKPFTAVAIMRLVEQGKLRLSDRAFDILRLDPVRIPATEPDPRVKSITVYQLLHHTAGWDSAKSGGFDPMFLPGVIARATATPAPARPEAIIRYMLGQPLDFDPGTRFSYSNFGYCVLGRVIERVSGMGYDEFVRREVLAPAGIRRMRLGTSRESAPGEVKYYTWKNDRSESVFPDDKGEVSVCYGGFYLEAMDAHGGWVASPVDLLRLAVALDDPGSTPLLRPVSRNLLYSRPPAPVARADDGSLTPSYYGCGWQVAPQGNGRANYWHNGSLPGTNSLLVRRSDGLSWAAIFNQRAAPGQPGDDDLDAALHRAANAMSVWPDDNLFSQFG